MSAGLATEHEKLDVLMVPPPGIDAIWPEIAEHIYRGRQYAMDVPDLDRIRDKLKSGELLAVVVIERGSDEVRLVLTVELVNTGTLGQVCNIVTAGGEEMHEWLTDWLDGVLVELARSQGCEYMTLKGRPGWVRALKGQGYHHLYTVVGKRITP